MKKSYLNFVLLLVGIGLVFLSSCKEDEPLPESTAAFQVASVAPEIHVPVQFVNNSLNANSYVWDYGDGTSLDSGQSVINTTHTYTESGTYTVRLRAYTQDGQVTEATNEISVGERYLTDINIMNIQNKNPQGKYWDEDSSGADVILFFGPVENLSQENFIRTPVLEDINDTTSENSTPTGFTLNADYVLNNELYFLDVLDVDSIPDEDPEFEVIFGNSEELYFNPMQTGDLITVEKFEDGTGTILFPWTVLGGTQILLGFEVR